MDKPNIALYWDFVKSLHKNSNEYSVLNSVANPDSNSSPNSDTYSTDSITHKPKQPPLGLQSFDLQSQREWSASIRLTMACINNDDPEELIETLISSDVSPSVIARVFAADVQLMEIRCRDSSSVIVQWCIRAGAPLLLKTGYCSDVLMNIIRSEVWALVTRQRQNRACTMLGPLSAPQHVCFSVLATLRPWSVDAVIEATGTALIAAVFK